MLLLLLLLLLQHQLLLLLLKPWLRDSAHLLLLLGRMHVLHLLVRRLRRHRVRGLLSCGHTIHATTRRQWG